MWKQEVIDLINHIHPRVPPVEHLRVISPKATPFYFGEAQQLDDIFKKTAKEEMRLFVNAPYDLTMVEWSESREPNDKENQIPAPKRVVIMETDSVAKIQTYYSFFLMGNTNEWAFEPYACKLDSTGVNLFNWIDCDIPKTFGREGMMVFAKELLADVAISQFFIDVLNCENVITKTVVPSNKRNAMRRREHKLPYYEYKILEVLKHKAKEKDGGVVPWGYKSPESVRFHLTRGHQKTYTEKAPLFGKTSGTFWWHDYARGDKEKGVIEKEYHVETKQEKRQ